MIDLIAKMFSESSEVSSMRIMAFLSLLCGVGISIFGIVQDKDLSQVAMLVSVFVGGAFGGKVVQKFAEIKGESNDRTNQK